MKKILIASVLKPVNEPRMYEKFASTLKEDFEVHILGFKATQDLTEEENVFFYPIFNFDRTSFKRLFVPFLFLKYAFKIKPNYLIINTIEILLPALIFKIITHKKVVYDVRENYFANVMYQNHYPNILKIPLAFFVRMLEKLSPLWVNHYFLAEKNYEKECPFAKNKFTVVANKFKSTSSSVNHISKNTNQKTLQFLLTGTLSEPYGTLEGIEFVKKIHQIDTNISLHIVGYCMDKIYLQKIKNAIQNCEFISLLGGQNAVPYMQIVNYTKKSDILLLPYLPNKSTQDCIPTKFYEAIALRKVMFIQKNKYWQELLKDYDVGVFIDFEQHKRMDKRHFERLVNSLRITDFYTQEIPKEFYLWEKEGKKMLNILLDL
jgi:hypothetical protein